MPFSIAHYLSAHSAYFPQFGDEETVYFIADISGVPQLWRVPFRPGQKTPFWPEQLTFDQERVLGLSVSPAGTVLIARDEGGNENTQFFRWRPGNPAQQLTRGYKNAQHNFGCWSPEGT